MTAPKPASKLVRPVRRTPKYDPTVYPDPGDGMGPYCLIELTRGKFAKCSPEDYEALAVRLWHAVIHSPTSAYAKHSPLREPCLLMHRVVLGLGDDAIVDHKNFDGLDNRRANLRPATYSQNNGHKRKRGGSSSKYKGVLWHRAKQTWTAAIHASPGSEKSHLGCFDNEEDAARAYDAAAVAAHGEFAVLNFPGSTGPAPVANRRKPADPRSRGAAYRRRHREAGLCENCTRAPEPNRRLCAACGDSSGASARNRARAALAAAVGGTKP